MLILKRCNYYSFDEVQLTKPITTDNNLIEMDLCTSKSYFSTSVVLPSGWLAGS